MTPVLDTSCDFVPVAPVTKELKYMRTDCFGFSPLSGQHFKCTVHLPLLGSVKRTGIRTVRVIFDIRINFQTFVDKIV